MRTKSIQWVFRIDDRQSFFHYGHLMALLICLLLVGRLEAYQIRCESVHRPKLEVSDPGRLAAEVKTAMAEYQNLMGFSQIRHDLKAMDQVKARLAELKSEQVLQLKSLIQNNYNKVRSLKYDTSAPYKSFKRQLDLIISEKSDAQRFFKKRMIDQGQSLEDTLSQYYAVIHEWTRSTTQMKGDDVLLAGLQLQDRFFKKDKAEETWTHPLALYGSFVNGRALAHLSDLDFVVTKAEKVTEFSEKDVLAALVDFPCTEAQAHFMERRSLHSLGYMNPLLLIVTKDHMVLRVYRSVQSKDLWKNVYFDEYYF